MTSMFEIAKFAINSQSIICQNSNFWTMSPVHLAEKGINVLIQSNITFLYLMI